MFANTFKQLMFGAFSVLVLAFGSATAMDPLDSMEDAADQMMEQTFGGSNTDCQSPDYEGDRSDPDDPCYMIEENGDENMDHDHDEGHDHF